ncbi:hypothetical protein [Guptibacillus spartinae]|uniref:hypothetical protein n=1 Tax=Guptibacillus spartinae TaxID=3025679 RepID=UPI00235E52B4|nr:hypothetical protein [Pseudalkalibacillus spartinae]
MNAASNLLKDSFLELTHIEIENINDFVVGAMDSGLSDFENDISLSSERITAKLINYKINSHFNANYKLDLFIKLSSQTKDKIFKVTFTTQRFPYASIYKLLIALPIYYSGSFIKKFDLKKTTIFTDQTEESMLQIEKGLKKFYLTKRFLTRTLKPIRTSRALKFRE